MPVKWTAPEILFGDAADLSSKSDVYVFFLTFGVKEVVFLRGSFQS